MDLTKQIQQTSSEMFDIYNLRIRYTSRLCGGVPRQLETALLRAEALLRKSEAPKEAVEQLKEEITARYRESMLETPDGDEGDEPALTRAWCTFHNDEDGAYVEARTMKSALRECLSKLGIFKKTVGSKGLHDYGFFVEPKRLRLERDGVVIAEPDGHMDRPITVQTRQGRQTSIKREDYFEAGTEMVFAVHVARQVAGKDSKTGKRPPPLLGQKEIINALALLERAGHGASRSQGFGQLEIVSCDHVQAGKGDQK